MATKKTKAEEQAILEEVKAADTAVVEQEAVEVVEEAAAEEKKAAKAGKRSTKGQEEAAAKLEKIEAQKTGEHKEAEDVEVKKGPAPKTRSKLERRSKGYKKAFELTDQTKEYSIKEASEVLPKTSTVKFDASVEIHVNLNVDPRQADQNIRATVTLPHGTGKTLRVAAFVPSDQVDAVKKAGADIAGEDEFLQQLDKEQLDFDVLVATPQLMAKLGKYARILGPRGLMPNPKSGTVSAKPVEAVQAAKAGKVEFRVDKQGIVHRAVGKVSFKPEQIAENTKAVLGAIKEAKPASVKGSYVEKVTMTTTMGPSVVIALSEV